jgi:hypothetical protein
MLDRRGAYLLAVSWKDRPQRCPPLRRAGLLGRGAPGIGVTASDKVALDRDGEADEVASSSLGQPVQCKQLDPESGQRHSPPPAGGVGWPQSQGAQPRLGKVTRKGVSRSSARSRKRPRRSARHRAPLRWPRTCDSPQRGSSRAPLRLAGQKP